MGQTTTEAKTTEILLDLLKHAETAHGLHEKELGTRDADWPRWYAEYMTRRLREAGYDISPAASS
jgi:hypothetical protein